MSFIASIINVSPLMALALAQVEGAAAPQLYAYGPLGIMCGWFMWRGEALIKEVRGYGHKIDGLRLAILAQAASSESTNPAVRRMCEEELARIRRNSESGS